MKSTAGFILALIGGILQIGIVIFVFVSSLFQYIQLKRVLDSDAYSALENLGTFDMMSTFRAMIIFYIVYMIWMLIMSILMIIASVKMNKDDDGKVRSGGIMALVVGILAPVNILTIIGGAIGMSQSGKKSPAVQTAPQNPVQQNPIQTDVRTINNKNVGRYY